MTRAMNVRDLIDKLSHLDPDTPVVVTTSDGNYGFAEKLEAVELAVDHHVIDNEVEPYSFIRVYNWESLSKEDRTTSFLALSIS